MHMSCVRSSIFNGFFIRMCTAYVSVMCLLLHFCFSATSHLLQTSNNYIAVYPLPIIVITGCVVCKGTLVFCGYESHTQDCRWYAAVHLWCWMIIYIVIAITLSELLLYYYFALLIFNYCISSLQVSTLLFCHDFCTCVKYGMCTILKEHDITAGAHPATLSWNEAKS